ncbi:hypothetical protein S40288_11608 [Stachybotrys chartarum IBT 40288]|nr:hypothetical protein S40288_11608 [Stachybotrys chartarum IBT 40288]
MDCMSLSGKHGIIAFAQAVNDPDASIAQPTNSIPFMDIIYDKQKVRRCKTRLTHPEVLLRFIHPSIAKVYYFFPVGLDNMLIQEYPDVNLLRLCPLPAKRMAAAVAQVIEGYRYLSNALDSSCFPLETTRVSVSGNVKLVLNLGFKSNVVADSSDTYTDWTDAFRQFLTSTGFHPRSFAEREFFILAKTIIPPSGHPFLRHGNNDRRLLGQLAQAFLAHGGRECRLLKTP